MSDSKKDNTANQQSQFVRVTATTFYRALLKAKEHLEPHIAWHVDSRTLDEFQQYEKEGGKFFVTNAGSTIAIKGDKEIISLCLSETDSLKAKQLVEFAESKGGTHFTCFESLQAMFQSYGYVCIGAISWNSDLAPKDWQPEFHEESVAMFQVDETEHVHEFDNMVANIQTRIAQIDERLKEHLSMQEILSLTKEQSQLLTQINILTKKDNILDFNKEDILK